MSIEEAIKILDYKINMYEEDVFIGDLDKTNIEAIKKVLKEIEKLNNIIKDSINYINWHYDLGTKDNVEFCILRDRLLSILKGVDKE